jgi:hypothetical protein
MLHITALREKAKIRLEKPLAASYVIHDLRLKGLHGWPSPMQRELGMSKHGMRLSPN